MAILMDPKPSVFWFRFNQVVPTVWHVFFDTFKVEVPQPFGTKKQELDPSKWKGDRFFYVQLHWPGRIHEVVASGAAPTWHLMASIFMTHVNLHESNVNHT